MNTRSGSTTVTRTATETSDKKMVLKLKEAKGPKIKWTEDTVDNEHLGRRSSKRCCIFHKVKKFGESDSDESDSDTEVARKQASKDGRPPNYQRHHA
mmetsp:Transcript_49300/g.97507  ORF Transcript_49300/g.97507 Transcript_49300/m.97507 type:complete len:97 (+) Transcript_49300:91-381(+)